MPSKSYNELIIQYSNDEGFLHYANEIEGATLDQSLSRKAAFEGFDSGGRSGHIHGVGQVHAKERHVDVLKRAHFRGAFGVTTDVNPRAGEVQYIAVTLAFGMKAFA